MQLRKIATGMIEWSYECIKESLEDIRNLPEGDEVDALDSGSNESINIWDSMGHKARLAAVEYVYENRNEIELHSGCVPAWVQATAYFMLSYFAHICIVHDKNATLDLECFFDDMDFAFDSSYSAPVSDKKILDQIDSLTKVKTRSNYEK